MGGFEPPSGVRDRTAFTLRSLSFYLGELPLIGKRKAPNRVFWISEETQTQNFLLASLFSSKINPGSEVYLTPP